ncbi:MAG: FAD:protein FMN transferase, partial [Gemmatimonadota bacterium]
MRGPACAALALALAACGGEESAERPGATGDRAARSAAGELAEVRRAWPVMGTLLEVVAWHPDSAAAAAAIHSARAAVTAVDSLMSNYRADSELSLLNRRAGGAERTPVSEWTARVLAASLEWGEASGGAFDVTVGPVVDVWGFYRERGAIPAPATLDSATSLVGHRGIDYDAAGASARLTRPGMRLDLGAIAKGFAVDRALDALGAAGVAAAMVDLGGNVGVLGASP